MSTKIDKQLENKRVGNAEKDNYYDSKAKELVDTWGQVLDLDEEDIKELKGYNALHSRNMNSIGVLEIQPITKLKPSIDNISITVYNSTTNTYYVRLPYLYNKELKEYIDGIVENKNIKLIMNVVKNDIISEETLLAKEMSLWDTSMRLYHNNIYDAMEDNRHFEDCDNIKGFKDLVGSIFKK